MKTEGIFYVAPNKVELRELEVGDPDLYQVQIELKASAICGPDSIRASCPRGPRIRSCTDTRVWASCGKLGPA